ncbi:MAG: PadR family transcriptional regulator [Gemmatimonadales bacterium]
MGDELELMRGTLDLLVLQTLAGEPLHGYAVATAIKERSGGELLVEEGALYPALHRLETKGLVEAEWGVSENNRKARYYALTRAGKRALKASVSEWERYVRAVDRVIAPTGSKGR